MKQLFNYHNHTSRCGHAVGTDEEYVKAAIAAGYQKMGFSDHAPYPGQYHPEERMDVSVLPEYIRSIKDLQARYRDQIDMPGRSRRRWRRGWRISSPIRTCSCTAARSGATPVNRPRR